MKLVTILVPAYNEENNIPAVIQRINEQIEKLENRYSFEVIFLDNRSTDATRSLVLAQCRRDRRWKYLQYSRNFGAEASMLAGLDHASGQAVINIFSDLQDPPEYIPEMLEKWEAGAEVVYGMVRKRNDSSLFKTLGAKVAYWLIYHLTECKIPPGATDFRLLDRRVILALRELREPDRYYRGLVHWVGFHQVPFNYDRAKRVAGASNANIFYCVKFALHAIICFSSRPMYFAMLFGLFLTLCSVLLAFIYIGLTFIKPAALLPAPPGLTTIILLALFILGVNSLFLGIIGEYIGRIYNQGKGRPLYILADKINFD